MYPHRRAERFFLLATVSSICEAAPVTSVVNGITYQADDTNQAAGATATAYDGSSQGAAITIASSVSIAGNQYPVLSIGASAFANQGLSSVSLPQGLATIGPEAFTNNLLEVVEIPASVTTIGDRAFYFNMMLAQVWLEGDAPAMGSGNTDAPLNDPVNVTVYYPCSASGYTSPVWQDYSVFSFCRVSFDSQGGSEVEGERVITGQTASTPAEPLRPGYSFDGWFTDPEATTPYDFSTAIDADITLYAKWTRQPGSNAQPVPVLPGWSLVLTMAILTCLAFTRDKAGPV